MIKTYKWKDLTWTDLENPTNEEIRSLIDAYRLPPVVAEDLVKPTVRPKVELYKDCIHLILHFPNVRRGQPDRTVQEIDFVIGRDYLITARYEVSDYILEFSKIFEVGTILEHTAIGHHAGFLFFVMMKHFYSRLLDEIVLLGNNLENVEAEIFRGREREMVFAISKASRDLLDFRKAIRMHGSILRSLVAAGREFFGEEFVPYLKLITNEYEQVEGMLADQSELVAELRDTNSSVVSTKQNEVMKTLTIVAFITLPLSVIAAIFQIDAVSRPLIGRPYDFWIMLAIMAAAVAVLFAIFKRKKWL